MQAPKLSEEELNAIYNWVDEIPLSRPKKNIARDFADGVLMAEIIHHFFPRIIELHNYSPAHSTSAKLYNWNTLNRKKLSSFFNSLEKVFKKMGFTLNKNDIEDVINCVPEAIERVIKIVQIKIEKYRESLANKDSNPSRAQKIGQVYVPGAQQLAAGVQQQPQ